MDISFVVGALAIVLASVLVFRALTYKSKSEREATKRTLENLENELLTDYVTGSTISVEQAKAGHYFDSDNEHQITPNDEIEKLPFENEKRMAMALNYLKKSNLYSKTNLDRSHIETLERTNMMSQYDEKTFFNSYQFNGGIVILPTLEISGTGEYEKVYVESPILFWVAIANIEGHYFLREKSSVDKIRDWFLKKDDLKIKNYESFTIAPSLRIIKIKRLLEHFENHVGLEIEIVNSNLFVKSQNFSQEKDILKLQEVINKVLI